MTSIPVENFKLAFIYALNCVQNKRAHLNKINVFPISDNDTGTNLSITTQNLLQASEEFNNYHEFFLTLSNRVFTKARGNSGMLLSIWIEGISNHCPAKKNITPSLLWQLFKHGYDFLLEEVNDIAKGSFITVIGDLCTYLVDNNQYDALTKISRDNLIKKIEVLVANTANENPVLVKHNFVDAGALGFSYLLHGLLDYLVDSDKILPNETNDFMSQNNHHSQSTSTPPNYRYCTEAILSFDHENKEKAKEIISKHGDCDLFLTKRSALRFHVHCNHPDSLFHELSQFSKISSPKIEDMLRQYQAASGNHKIALISDSSVDLSDDLLESFYVHRIPASIMQGDNEWVDGCGIDSERLYRNLKGFKQYPTTATPALGKIQQTFEYLLQHYQHLLVISVSAKLSGTYNAIAKVAGKNKKIHLINSQKNSGAQGLLVTYAGKLIKKGYPIEQIVEKVLETRHQLNIFVSVKNFDAMIRSGRVSPLKGAIAKLINIKPLISLSESGKGIVVTKAMSIKKSREKLIRLVSKKHQQKPVTNYNLMHVSAKEEALKVAKQLERILLKPPQFIKSVTPSIGLHAGIGAIAVAIHQGDN